MGPNDYEDFDEEVYDEEPIEYLDDEYTEPILNNGENQNNQKNKNNQKTSKSTEAAKLAAETAATAYGGKLGGTAVKAFSKTNLGQKTFNKVGNAMDSVIKHPIGIVNPAANLINENNFNEEMPRESELNNNNGLTSNNDLDSKKDNNNLLDNFKNKKNDKDNVNPLGSFELFKSKKLRIYAIIGLSVLLVFFVMFFAIIASKDHAMLDLTGSIYKPSSKGNGGAGYSKKNIEKALLYVGDSRVLDMQNHIESNTVKFVGSENADYEWLANTGRSEINSKLNDGGTPVKFVVIGLGLYDLDNADKYVNIFNSLSSNSDVNYIFMSVTPVNEEKAPSSMTNAKINSFNSTISSKIEKYVDTTSAVSSDFKTTDGIKYDTDTYRAIHELVLDYIKANFSGGFLDEYPHGTEGTELLYDNIIKVIGQSEYDNLNNSVKSGVQNSGICSKESAAIAGVNLAYGLYQLGYRVPYYWDGGHRPITVNGEQAYVDYTGVDSKLGEVAAPSCSSDTCYNHYGYDCSGFVNWAVSTSMARDVSVSLDGWVNRSTGISMDEAEPGDIITMSGHIILVIENKGDYLQTLESTGGNNGLIFRTYNNEEISSLGANVRSLSPFYEQEC